MRWEREPAFTSESRVSRIVDANVERLEEVLEDAANVVFAGGTVIFPTDTSYALACDPYRSDAVDRVYAALGRPDQRPLTIHVASTAEFLEYAGDNALAVHVAKRFLPGPLIVLIRKPQFISDDLAAGLQTVALRVPDDSLAASILERCGPLAGVSANPPGGPRYRGDAAFDGLPPADLLIQHGPTLYDRESTIVDLTGSHARLLREGVVPEARLAELLGPIERPTIKVRTQRS